MDEVALPNTPGTEMDAEIEPHYIQQIHALKDFELTTLYVDYSHLLDRDPILARAIGDQYYR